MWGNSDLQWLLAAQQLPSGWVASSVPRQTTPAHGRAQVPMQEVSRSLTLPRGKFWSWEGCRPCSKQGIISQGRGQLPGACGGWCNAERERNKCEEGGKKDRMSGGGEGEVETDNIQFPTTALRGQQGRRDPLAQGNCAPLSRHTGLGTEMLPDASPWLQEAQGQRHLPPDIQPGPVAVWEH